MRIVENKYCIEKDDCVKKMTGHPSNTANIRSRFIFMRKEKTEHRLGVKFIS